MLKTITKTMGVLLCAALSTHAASARAQAVPCEPGQLALSLDDGGGDFNGMSHGGTYVVLRNRGRSRCQIPARPDLAFLDANEQTLQASLQATPGMHPGPVLLPVVIPPHASVRASLRWVTGEVFDDSQCIDASALRVGIGQGALTAPLQAHLCGARAQGPQYQFVPFQPKRPPTN
ncbi:hypothetical protein F4827_005148 [Paraburkholderia bannensis]|uniref:DUF4232 domain-containing protein n=1 Tax=Paraburkholderia bannensis TaxID=765414 RepID=A0A7W9WVE6_9BURK|nr:MULTISPECIES: DUF4232 domain-containing protein [Paraburkholderia]MBB3260076.1 hypothetical protein [Paraburkholderia sp. WP4_3_2]MBB6105282.1 hypothetical protein [Paraburkholderia bannensis]